MRISFFMLGVLSTMALMMLLALCIDQFRPSTYRLSVEKTSVCVPASRVEITRSGCVVFYEHGWVGSVFCDPLGSFTVHRLKPGENCE